MTNCPNCGAPIKGPVCEYCDTRFPNRHDYMASVASGIMTVNEAREAIGLKRLARELEIELLAEKNGFMQNLYKEAINAMRSYTTKF